jgi:hypothetical protein
MKKDKKTFDKFKKKFRKLIKKYNIEVKYSSDEWGREFLYFKGEESYDYAEINEILDY